MNADFPVVLDACVLANQRVTDLLLRLAWESICDARRSLAMD